MTQSQTRVLRLTTGGTIRIRRIAPAVARISRHVRNARAAIISHTARGSRIPPRPSPRFMLIRCSAKAEWVRSAGVRRESSVDWPGQKQAVPAPSSASSANACQASRISGKRRNDAAWSSSPSSSVFRPPLAA